MAAPTSYTESTFKTYMVDEVLGDVATELEWTSASTAVTNAVNETLLALNSDDIAEFDSKLLIRKLRAFGRREIWRQAAQFTAAQVNVMVDGAQAQLSQLHAQCKAMYEMESANVLNNYGGDDGELESEAPVAVLRRRTTVIDPYAASGFLREEYNNGA